MEYSIFEYRILKFKMKQDQVVMRPHDIAVLLKIVSNGDNPWYQKPMSEELMISQSEFSKSIRRSSYANLTDASGRKIRKLALMDFLEKGISYAFPQRPGALVRGIPTSHSASPLKEQIQSCLLYTSPSPRDRG